VPITRVILHNAPVISCW